LKADHSLYGKDMGPDGKKNIADERVVDEVMAILTDPIFIGRHP